jgi:hypothetical protein
VPGCRFPPETTLPAHLRPDGWVGSVLTVGHLNSLRARCGPTRPASSRPPPKPWRST